jgi:hypothetical protein
MKWEKRKQRSKYITVPLEWGYIPSSGIFWDEYERDILADMGPKETRRTERRRWIHVWRLGINVHLHTSDSA